MVGSKPWTEPERKLLRKCFADGMQLQDIHEKHFAYRTLESVRGAYKRLKARVEKTQRNQTPTTTDTVREDVRCITVDRLPMNTVDAFLAKYPVDQVEWRLDSITFNQWEMGAVINGEVVVTPLYQAKGIFKRNILGPLVRDQLASLIDDAKKQVKPVPARTYPKRLGRPYALEISIPDLHMNKYAELDATGARYDPDIAERLFMAAVDHHLAVARANAVEQIVFVAGNDILNVDSSAKTTTKGTPQDVAISHFEAFKRTRMMLVNAVRLCAEVAPVQVFLVPGNHDYNSVFYLGECLDIAFHRDPDVQVVNHLAERKYWEYGAALVMFTHGNTERQEDLPLLMATERPEAWARTKHREAHTAHRHQAALKERMGVRVRTIPSLSAADNWHVRKGYVGNLRVSESYLWDRESGLSAIHTYVPKPSDLV